MYEYRATVLQVIDGDTVDLDIDLGLRTHVKERIRLDGINTMETNSKVAEEREAAKAATEFLRSLLIDPKVTLKTKKDSKEKFGRYLGVVTNSAGVNVNEALVAAGHAKAYSGGAR
jgi:micrococcal nuclease